VRRPWRAHNFLFHPVLGGSGRDDGYGIAVDASGSSYTTGYFTGNMTVGSTTLLAEQCVVLGTRTFSSFILCPLSHHHVFPFLSTGAFIILLLTIQRSSRLDFQNIRQISGQIRSTTHASSIPSQHFFASFRRTLLFIITYF